MHMPLWLVSVSLIRDITLNPLITAETCNAANFGGSLVQLIGLDLR